MPKRISHWLWALPSLLGALVLAFGWPLASDQDLYLHLKTGERTEQLGGWPARTDSFSYTDPGAPEETHSWLSQWILYRVHAAHGPAGVRALNALALLGLIALLYLYVWQRGGSAPAAGMAAALAVVAQGKVQTFRPLVLGQLAAAVLLFGILDPSRPWNRRRGFAALGLCALWSNLHGSALIAPLFLLLRTRNAFWMLGAAAAVCLNPSGPAIWADSILILQTGKSLGIGEWTNPAPPTILWIATIGAGWALLRHPKDWTAVAAVGLCALAFSAHRHVAWLFFSIAASAGLIARTVPIRTASAALGIAVALWGSRFWVSGRSTPRIDRTVDFLEATGVEGPAFNHPGWGSYLVFRLHPKIPVAHTMRLLTHRRTLEWEKDQWVKLGGLSLADVVERWPETRLAILPAKWPIPYFADPRDWGIAYVNDQAAVLLRKFPENEENWKRIEAYYSAQHVPFSRDKGFIPGDAYAQRPDWWTQQEEPGGWGRWPDPEKVSDANRIVRETESRWLAWPGVGQVPHPQRFYWKDGRAPQGMAQP